jgi:hypothetical protein
LFPKAFFYATYFSDGTMPSLGPLARKELVMPRFFFDTFDGVTEVQDDIGLICEREAVVRKAVGALPELASDLTEDLAREFWVRVRTEGGGNIFMACLILRTRWLG